MQPYNPEILPLGGINWVEHVYRIGQAHAALARYDGMLRSIVNPDVLLSPLMTHEAVLSSRIEGTQATMEEVLEYEADPHEPIEPSKHADIQEIINYRLAINHAVTSLEKRPLCLNLLRDLHAVLLDSVRGRNKAPGEFRRVQNFIGPPNCTQEEATFVPPSPERIPIALDNWEKYCHYEEKDVLVQLAIVKAQFELIHPFLDGNGRIGRMLVPIFLFVKGVLSSPVFYPSAYLEANRELYYQHPQAISQKGDWNGWIGFFLSALSDQAKANIEKVRAISELYEKMKRDVPQITRSRYAINAIDALFDQPILQSSHFISRGIPRESASRILRLLREEDLLVEIRPGKGRRAGIFAFMKLLGIVGI